MAIADTITSMQNHTSNAYTMIGYGTDLTGINKNLENLSSTIFNAFLEALRTPDTLFTNLPKKSGSGSNITLNDTANAPMRIELGASELTQASTTQLFDFISGATDKRVATGSGGTYGATGYSVSNYIEVKPNTTYKLAVGEQSFFCWYDSNKTYLSGTYWNNNNEKTSPNNAGYIRFDFQTSNINNVSFTTTSPTPDYPSEVHTISGDNTILVRGKNLFNKDIGFVNGYINDSGTFVSNNTIVIFNGYIPVEGNNYYTFSANTTLTNLTIVAYDSNKNFISRHLTQNYNINIWQLPQNCKYVRLQFNYNNTENIITQALINTLQLQLEKSNQATTYEPYVSQEADIDLNGANLISDIPYKVNYYIDASGNEQYSNGTAIYKFNCQSNTQYTFSLYNGTSSGNLRIHAYNGNTWLSQIDVISTTAGNDYTKTFTTPNNANNVRISFYNYTRNIMVNKGNIALPYSKYSPINYSKISTYEDKFIRTSGKNLLPVTNQDYTINSVRFRAENGSIKINGTASANITGFVVRTDDYFPITLEAGTYYFKRNLTNLSVGLIKANSDNATVTLSGSSTATSTTFTLTEKTKLYLFFYIASGTTISNQDWQIMVSKTNDDYEPYGNGTWYIKKNIGKVVLDGSENLWSMYGETGKRKWYLQKSYFGNQVPFVNWSDKSNRFGYSGYISGAWTNNKFGWHTSANSMVFDTDFGESLSDWTTWLASNNVIIYYAYSTPTYTQITGTLETQLENVYQKLLSQTGTTNISQVNNDLPFIMNVQAIEV